MNTRTFLLGCLMTGTAMLTACSQIDEGERLIYVEPTEAQRVVLVEDFTGQKCVNCPNATNVLHEILEAYGDANTVYLYCNDYDDDEYTAYVGYKAVPDIDGQSGTQFASL